MLVGALPKMQHLKKTWAPPREVFLGTSDGHKGKQAGMGEGKATVRGAVWSQEEAMEAVGVYTS